MKQQIIPYYVLILSVVTIGVSPLRSGDFEGVYRVGNQNCRVKPIKMAFEVYCENTRKKEIYFYQGEENKNIIFKSDDGTLSGRFIFKDSSLKSGVFIGGDGIRWKVKKDK
ncbi:hypothetical protein A0128_06225 [Leptospira tipperaryensis]|uniref:Lysozyme inhibitor n=1 Tax=Leptospira tipperaryensis TaxID=2564040 RepID=A0A1D7UV91_9LEPT|nr:hypothetical protein [Leptospira tipperaryensis]AOP33478.1 hypothetical protein A0128_06225 [Leptospira tipperaryensis]